MRLLSLNLENFQGVKSLKLSFEGGTDTSIRGANGSGKTTVANALSYLWSDKDTADTPGYTPKTTDNEGNDLHYLNHTVEAQYRRDDGSITTLKKDYHEVYTRAKGTTSDNFTGHTTDYYIDGVPATATNYKAYLDELVPTAKVRILTLPDYFPEALHWKNRREILLEVCGDITDLDVIGSCAELADLPEFLKKPGDGDKLYKVEEYQKIAKAAKAKINEELQSIPNRIDENTRFLDTPDDPDIDRKIERAKIELDILVDEKRNLQSTGNADLKRQKAELEAELATAKTAHLEDVAQRNESANATLKTLRTELGESESRMRSLNDDLKSENRTLTDLQNRRAAVMKRYESVSERQANITTVCPTCEQPIPEDRIASATEQFNLAKSKELEDINAEGSSTCSKDMISECDERCKKIESSLEAEKSKAVELKEKIRRIEATIVTPNFPATAEYATITAKLASVAELIGNEGKTTVEQENAVSAKIRAKEEALAGLQSAKGKIASAAQARLRIDELSKREQELATDYERLDKGIWLTEEFTRRKSAMLDEKINSKFETVRFRLFKKNTTNDGIEEICEVLCKTSEGLVPYSKPANTASRLNASLEIIDTLGQHWGTAMPIVIDGAESITKIKPTASQQIRLYVDEAYPPLTIATR